MTTAASAGTIHDEGRLDGMTAGGIGSLAGVRTAGSRRTGGLDLLSFRAAAAFVNSAGMAGTRPMPHQPRVRVPDWATEYHDRPQARQNRLPTLPMLTQIKNEETCLMDTGIAGHEPQISHSSGPGNLGVIR